MKTSEKGLTFGVNLTYRSRKSLRRKNGDPYGTRSRLKAFGNLRVDSSKRLNNNVLIRRTKKV